MESSSRLVSPVPRKVSRNLSIPLAATLAESRKTNSPDNLLRFKDRTVVVGLLLLDKAFVVFSDWLDFTLVLSSVMLSVPDVSRVPY
jgi:hypothetical protein